MWTHKTLPSSPSQARRIHLLWVLEEHGPLCPLISLEFMRLGHVAADTTAAASRGQGPRAVGACSPCLGQAVMSTDTQACCFPAACLQVTPGRGALLGQRVSPAPSEEGEPCALGGAMCCWPSGLPGCIHTGSVPAPCPAHAHCLLPSVRM